MSSVTQNCNFRAHRSTARDDDSEHVERVVGVLTRNIPHERVKKRISQPANRHHRGQESDMSARNPDCHETLQQVYRRNPAVT